jgi:NhaA family Na+:H+ antiporter
LKREMLEGRLNTPREVMLPGIAALGGMLAPMAVYLMLTRGDPGLTQGWAIPAATDIAFAVGVLALLGKSVPPALKIFLLTLAILDDLGAILIIALFTVMGCSPNIW